MRYLTIPEAIPAEDLECVTAPTLRFRDYFRGFVNSHLPEDSAADSKAPDTGAAARIRTRTELQRHMEKAEAGTTVALSDEAHAMLVLALPTRRLLAAHDATTVLDQRCAAFSTAVILAPAEPPPPPPAKDQCANSAPDPALVDPVDTSRDYQESGTEDD